MAKKQSGDIITRGARGILLATVLGYFIWAYVINAQREKLEKNVRTEYVNKLNRACDSELAAVDAEYQTFMEKYGAATYSRKSELRDIMAWQYDTLISKIGAADIDGAFRASASHFQRAYDALTPAQQAEFNALLQWAHGKDAKYKYVADMYAALNNPVLCGAADDAAKKSIYQAICEKHINLLPVDNMIPIYGHGRPNSGVFMLNVQLARDLAGAFGNTRPEMVETQLNDNLYEMAMFGEQVHGIVCVDGPSAEWDALYIDTLNPVVRGEDMLPTVRRYVANRTERNALNQKLDSAKNSVNAKKHQIRQQYITELEKLNGLCGANGVKVR